MFHVELMENLNKCPACNSTEIHLSFVANDYFLSGEEFQVMQCSICSLRFTSPRPSAAESGRYYESKDYISHDTSRKDLLTHIYTLARNFMLGKKFKIVRKHIRGKKILDIGCGTGEFLNHCKINGLEAYGVEVNQKPRDAAKMNYDLDVRGNIAEFSPEQFKFDCISLWHVLEHIHELEKTMDHLKAYLNPEGVLIIALPNCRSWDADHYGKFWAAWDLPRHIYHFDIRSFTKFAEIKKLKIVETRPQVLDSFYVSLLSEKYLKSKLGMFKAFVYGLISNLKARNEERGYSSMIYIVKPEKI